MNFEITERKVKCESITKECGEWKVELGDEQCSVINWTLINTPMGLGKTEKEAWENFIARCDGYAEILNRLRKVAQEELQEIINQEVEGLR